MLLTVGEFCSRTRDDMPGLVLDLQQATKRNTPSEARAWTNSLSRVAEVLGESGLERAHLHVGRTSVSVEYRLPSANNWCDVVLLGRGGGRPRAVMLELKDWDTHGDRPGSRENLVEHAGHSTLHPSDQVRGYVEYCREFHSSVAEASADVVGCAFFTKAQHVSAYVRAPHEALVAQYPVFSSSLADLQRRLPDWLSSHIDRDDKEFAVAFEGGHYRQQRGLLTQVANAIEQSERPHFVLLDGQRFAYETCLAAIDEVLQEVGTRRKATILIAGPPGSGKSIVAARLWAHLAMDERVRGNVAFVTTSGCQKSNWESLFEQVAGRRAGAGFVVPANRFNPGISPQWVKYRRGEGYEVEIDRWRDTLELFMKKNPKARMPDDSLDVAIVDEAHALIDPTAPGARGVSPSGWAMHAGPQAWHVQRAARVSIFLYDPAQSYRDNETTGAESIETAAREHGIKIVRKVSLEGAQFRCGGSTEYLEWLERVLGLRESCGTTATVASAATAAPAAASAANAASAASGSSELGWRRTGNSGLFEFELAADPLEVEERLRARLAEGRTARLASSYSRPWKTKDSVAPHDLAADNQDFCFSFARGSKQHTWSRVWNFAPAQDYTLFIQAPKGTRMHEDPLSEVGCPYVLRGFDFDYIGLLWGRDLVWRGKWEVDLAHVHESAFGKSKSAARKGGAKSAAQGKLLDRVLRGYRILLSRAIRGVHVWIEDEETQEHVRAMLRG